MSPKKIALLAGVMVAGSLNSLQANQLTAVSQEERREYRQSVTIDPSLLPADLLNKIASHGGDVVDPFDK